MCARIYAFTKIYLYMCVCVLITCNKHAIRNNIFNINLENLKLLKDNFDIQKKEKLSIAFLKKYQAL